MPISVVGTVAAISVATVLFVVPLVVKYHVYKPSVKSVIVGDVIRLEEPTSSVWCQGVSLHSEAPFEAYVYHTEPRVLVEGGREKTLSTHRFLLPNRAQEFWGFHLLKGSIVELSACARLIGGDVTVVKGHSELNQCLDEHKQHLIEEGNSGEVSESESDEDTSSISSSQGAVINDTENLYVCKKSLEHRDLPPSYSCLSPEFPTRHIMSLSIEETAYYYFIFSSRTYLEIIPNEFFVQFEMERTHYDYASSFGNCSSGRECSVDVYLRREQHVVVQMERTNSTLMSRELQISCEPREWLFFLFYAGFLLIVFICAFQ